MGVIEYGTPQCENESDEWKALAEQEKFIKEKVREFVKANTAISLSADRVRQLAAGSA